MPLSTTADTQVRTVGEESHLSLILILSDFVGERLTLEVVLRYESCKLAKIASFCCKAKHHCGRFLQENVSLGKLRHQGFIALCWQTWSVTVL